MSWVDKKCNKMSYIVTSNIEIYTIDRILVYLQNY